MDVLLNLEKITNEVCEIARETGKFLAGEIGNIRSGDILTKGTHDFVTYVDKSSEKMIMTGLNKILPEAGFIAEESPEKGMGERFNWVIDPLDGTTNYIHAIPLYSISIGLLDGQTPVSGVVLEINMDECFYAWKNGGAFLNGNSIKVSKKGKIHESLFATGFPYYDYSRLDPYLEFFKFLIKNSHGVRRLGSAAADLAYVACGRFEGFYEYGLHSWDVTAGALIVEEAGGKVTDFTGNHNYIFGKEIVATNELVQIDFLNSLNNYFARKPN